MQPTPAPPFVSVIVATYNRNDLLCDTLRQLLEQDYGRFEILVVDQSLEHDEATTEFLAALGDRIRYFRVSPPNLPAARNFGIRQARGELVCFFDDDVLLPPTTLRALVASFHDENVWGVATREVERDDVKLPPPPPAPLRQVSIFNVGSSAFRKELFQRIGGFDEWLGTQPMAAAEDSELCYRATLAGYRLYASNVPYHHLVAPSGGCGRRSLDPDWAYRQQLRLRVYMFVKVRPGRGIVAWARALWSAYRTCLLNRASSRGSLFADLPLKHWLYVTSVFSALRVLRQRARTQPAGMQADLAPRQEKA